MSLPVKNNCRQSESAGQEDVRTKVEVPLMGCKTHVGTTDVSLPVKNRQTE